MNGILGSVPTSAKNSYVLIYLFYSFLVMQTILKQFADMVLLSYKGLPAGSSQNL
ncbi:MAG: hypothetical protein H6609_17035 [Ignavibacteriales bacterium]|nr:hypothetical protein [Ignavibacteriales bacterium]